MVAITAVGSGEIVMVAEPLVVPVHLESLNEISEKVFVDTGDTFKIYGLVVIPEIAFVVVPSE